MKFFRKQIIPLVVLTALVSLLGLVIAQFFILKETMSANKLLFEQKIGLISQTLSEEFRRDNSLVMELENAVDDPGECMPRFDVHFRAFVDSVFDTYAVPVKYQYGIYTHKGNDFEKKWSDIEDPHFTFKVCKNYAQVNLTCGSGYSSGHHMAMVFPDEELYLIDQSSKSIRVSLIFIGLILVSFIFAIVTIRRQRKLSELKNDFINNLSHEFKTPVFSIGVALKTIRKTEEFKRAERIHRYIEVIENENERLKNQVDKILQLALVQSGNFLLEKRTFHIHDALKRIVSHFGLVIEERNARIKFDLSARRTVIQADETHLSNAFYNLLDNALKYTDETPEIHISTFDTAPGVAICIGDNGVGISKEAEHFIFDQFYHSHSRPGISGFGLGLHYVRSVVEAHSGKIAVRSNLPQGSEFIIYLPVT